MIVVFAAMDEEVRPIRRRLGLRRVNERMPVPAWRGTSASGDVLLVQTGIGRTCAETAVQHVLDQFPIRHIFSVGFGGALTATLQHGDIVICSGVQEGASKNAAEGTPQLMAPSWLVNAAVAAVQVEVPRSFVGQGVTVRSVVMDDAGKLSLRESFGAMVVDMESFWIVQRAASCKIPCLSIRAVSDMLHQEIPEIVRRQTEEGGSRGRLVASLIRHPSTIRTLLPLAAHAFVAGRRLSEALAAILSTGIQQQETA